MYPVGYNGRIMIVRETDIFKSWMRMLKDRIARSIINARIRRLSVGNEGDSKHIGDGISELRIDYGPGYRVYYIKVEQQIIVLLCGGDKSTQTHDIKKAKQIAINLEVKE
jgi:putative addiction module killer protein